MAPLNNCLITSSIKLERDHLGKGLVDKLPKSRPRQFRWVSKLRFVDSYYQNKLYISAKANSIKRHWQHRPHGQKLIMSFHGEPTRTLQPQ